MFSLKEFLKRGLLDAVGKLADYQVILNAAGWFEKGVLTQEDLAEIQAKIDEKNTQVEETNEVEESSEELSNHESEAEA